MADSAMVIDTYDARRQRARNFLWTLDYLGMPLQLKLLVDNNVRKEVWSQFPFFSSEVRAKYGWMQGAWIIDLNGKLVASEPGSEPMVIDPAAPLPVPVFTSPCRTFWTWRLELILNDIFGLAASGEGE